MTTHRITERDDTARRFDPVGHPKKPWVEHGGDVWRRTKRFPLRPGERCPYCTHFHDCKDGPR